jgi:hypothetical protein
MKKLLYIILAIVAIFFLVLLLRYNLKSSILEETSRGAEETSTIPAIINDAQSNIYDGEWSDNINYIQSRIQKTILSKDFKKLTLLERSKVLEVFMEELIVEKRIVKYDVFLNSDIPHITFDYVDGGSGMVALQDFPENVN